MRNFILRLTILSFIFITINSCKKQDIGNNDSIEKDRIVNFIKASSDKIKGIDTEEILLALEGTGFQFEGKDDGENKIGIAKINRKPSKFKDAGEYLYMVSFYDQTQMVRKVKMMSYQSPRGNFLKELPRNTINGVINTGNNKVNGEFKFYSIDGKFEFSLNYINGYLSSVSNVTNFSLKAKGVQKISNSNSRKANWVYECSDVYLVTSYYDSNGNYLYQTREFLYRQGNCSGIGENQIPQPDENSGGVPEEYEYAIAKTTQWQVGNLPENLPTFSDGAVTSWERIKGKRVSTEPQGGHFTSISHHSDECRCGDLVWMASEVSGSASAQTATARVKGGVYWAGTNYTLDNTSNWSFSQIFP